jgi:hypothetical protein
VVERFPAALTGGDMQALMDVLAPAVDTVWLNGALGDRISRVHAVRNPRKLHRLTAEPVLTR